MTTMTPKELLDSWHLQQRAFIELRDLRTRTMVDVLARVRQHKGSPIRVLDLGCGPGSLGTAVLERIPDSVVVGVDRDPILLRLAKETNTCDQQTFVDADITEPGWNDSVGAGFDGAISATALHWLAPDQLVRLYLDLASIMVPGGVFMNADHLYYDAHQYPYLRSLSESVRDDFQASELESGVLSWDEWWNVALSMPGWEAEAELYHQRWATKHTAAKVDEEFHLAALRAAGFIETNRIFQWFDDRIVFGKLPE